MGNTHRQRRDTMEFPCENCIVDPMCINPCFDLRIYLSKISSIDLDYTITSARLRRVYNLTTSSSEYFRHYSILYLKYIKKKRENEIPI